VAFPAWLIVILLVVLLGITTVRTLRCVFAKDFLFLFMFFDYFVLGVDILLSAL
jgi:hypothetical protein